MSDLTPSQQLVSTSLVWVFEIADGRLTHLRTYHENQAR